MREVLVQEGFGNRGPRERGYGYKKGMSRRGYGYGVRGLWEQESMGTGGLGNRDMGTGRV